MWCNQNSHALQWDVNAQPESVLATLEEVKPTLTAPLSAPALYHPRENGFPSHRTSNADLMAALLLLSQSQNQLRGPSGGDWLIKPVPGAGSPPGKEGVLNFQDPLPNDRGQT